MIIDKAKAIELLERAVAEKGADYVDPAALAPGGCVYTINGHPACIVGYAYFYAGATLGQLSRLNAFGSIDGVLASDVELPIDTEIEAINAFAAAQEEQDSGWSWGVALEAAKAVAA